MTILTVYKSDDKGAEKTFALRLVQKPNRIVLELCDPVTGARTDSGSLMSIRSDGTFSLIPGGKINDEKFRERSGY